MGEIRIRLRGNATTGEREVVVEYDSAADRTRLEHEQRHREIVEQLVRAGVVTREEAASLPVRGVVRPDEQAEAAESAG
ncbi:MAG: hypothetical protein IT204_01440 [Fimbriimonadaceae bacterium]|nr:hypothetical protein [Fimbriimonadaceae bacterium]